MDTTSEISRASQIISSYPTENLQLREPIDLDDLLGFKDIWQKPVVEVKSVIDQYLPNKLFINHIDCFNGKYLSQFFLQQTFGFKPETDEEGFENEEEEYLEDDGEKSAKERITIEKLSSVTNEKAESLSVGENNTGKEEAVEKLSNIVVPDYTDDDLEINMLEEFALKYKDNIFYELYDFSQLTVQDYYELSAIETEAERRNYLKQKFKKEKPLEPPKHLSSYDEEQVNPVNEPKQKMKTSLVNFEVIGTLKNSESVVQDNITIIQNPENQEMLLKQLINCGSIIYDITRSPEQVKEATWALNAILTSLSEREEKNPEEFKQSNKITFILISSLMTWALTKPMDPDDPDLPFMEEDYRRRKAHPNYKAHLTLEREVLAAGKKFKDQFKTAVIACGVIYGFEEDILHYIFKMGWQNAEKLPVFNRGRNLIPLIHIDDLAAIIYGILSDFPPLKNRYIFAKEPTSSTLKDIIKAVSSGLTTGKIEKLSKEDAFLLEDEVNQNLYDIMTTNLNIEAGYVDDMNINWKDELGFVESIEKFINEYKEARNLKPLRIFLHGPTGSRRSMLAKRLCEYYKLQHLTVDNVIEDYITTLKNKIQNIKDKEKEIPEEEEGEEKVNITEVDAEAEGEGEEEEVEEEEEKDEETLEDLEENLKDIEENMHINFDKLDDEHTIKILKERLLSKPCQNQGFVLDGYPQTKSQAKSLFESDTEEEGMEEEQEGGEQTFNKNLIPDYIFSLDATDKVLFENALLFGKEESNGEQYTESEILQNNGLFRKLSDSEEEVLDYFHELEILPIQIDIETDTTQMLDDIFGEVLHRIGKPRNYDQFKTESPEERKQREETEHQQMLERQKKEEKEKELLNLSRRDQMEKWALMVDKLKAEEEQMLAAKSVTVRNYLIREIFPTLTRGLIEVSKIKPEDPVDYLAEYLFKTNPSGRMFQPEYTEEGEELALLTKKFTRLLNMSSKVHLV